jgi:hypothetical protein
MKNIGVVVGYGHDYSKNSTKNSQEKIAEALESKGYNVKRVDEQWPRDSYVNFQGNYVLRGPEGVSGNVFGEGGNVQRGDGFLLVSDNAYLFNQIKDNVNIQDYLTSEKKVIEEGKKYHNSRIHVAPTGIDFSKNKPDFSRMGHGHIDMFTLVLPKSKLLFYDTHFGKGANDTKKYNEIAEREGLELIEFDGKKDNVWYPLNAAVIPSKEGETVLMDRHANSLIWELYDRGVKPILVDMPQVDSPAGKINCQTNTYQLKDSKLIDSIFD